MMSAVTPTLSPAPVPSVLDYAPVRRSAPQRGFLNLLFIILALPAAVTPFVPLCYDDSPLWAVGTFCRMVQQAQWDTGMLLILLALPFFVFVLLNFINPEYMRPLYSTLAGQGILAVAGVGLLIGWITMNWISKLEV